MPLSLFILLLFLAGMIPIAMEHKIHIHKMWSALALNGIWIVAFSVNPEGAQAQIMPMIKSAGGTALFVYGATMLAEVLDFMDLFERYRYYVATRGWGDRKQFIVICLTSLIPSGFVDNVGAATMNGKAANGLFRGLHRTLAHIAIGLLSLIGGIAFIMGDVTSFQLYEAGMVTFWGLPAWALFPAYLAGAVVIADILPHMKGATVDDNSPVRLEFTEWIIAIGTFVVFLGTVVLHFTVHIPLYVGYVGGLIILLALNFGFRRAYDKPTRHHNMTALGVMKKAQPRAAFFIFFIIAAVHAMIPLKSLDLIGALYEMSSNPAWWAFLHTMVGISSGVIENVAELEAVIQATATFMPEKWAAFLAGTIALGAGITSIGSTSLVVLTEMNKDLTFAVYFKHGFKTWLKAYATMIGAFLFEFAVVWVWQQFFS